MLVPTLAATVMLDGRSLTPADVVAVARDRAHAELTAEAWARNAAAREAIAVRLGRGLALYGATTGVGALRDRTIEEAERERFQWNLLRSHAVDAGRPLTAEVVRAGMVVRANQLGAGGAGVHPALLEALVTALEEPAVPLIRELGSLGTGDLPALAALALALLGEGRTVAGDPIARAPALEGVRLGLRDALSFMSSNAFTIGHAALLVHDARALQSAWLAVAALSFEALEADPVVLDPRVQDASGTPGQAAVARRLRGLLADASLFPAGPDRLVQDPYPFRVLPQVDGVSDDALGALERAVSRALNARAENALIEAGDALPNGNFHLAEVAAALDGTRSALAASGSLIAARISALMDPRMSGLPPFLAGHPGVESGVMMLEYPAHAAAADMRSLAVPMSTQTVSASLGVESHGSLAATAARRTAQSLESMRLLVACELVVALRALEAAGARPAGAAARRLSELAAGMLPGGLEDRRHDADVEAAVAILGRWRDPVAQGFGADQPSPPT